MKHREVCFPLHFSCTSDLSALRLLGRDALKSTFSVFDIRWGEEMNIVQCPIYRMLCRLLTISWKKLTKGSYSCVQFSTYGAASSWNQSVFQSITFFFSPTVRNFCLKYSDSDGPHDRQQHLLPWRPNSITSTGFAFRVHQLISPQFHLVTKKWESGEKERGTACERRIYIDMAIYMMRDDRVD